MHLIYNLKAKNKMLSNAHKNKFLTTFTCISIEISMNFFYFMLIDSKTIGKYCTKLCLVFFIWNPMEKEKFWQMQKLCWWQINIQFGMKEKYRLDDDRIWFEVKIIEFETTKLHSHQQWHVHAYSYVGSWFYTTEWSFACNDISIMII